jgi:predicted DsbA family dithiol-disulfide isomerase/uncharacterized membrane protein
MPKRAPFWITIVACALALGASAVLLVDYLRPAPVFCGVDGGCGTLRQTVFAYPLGVPLPVWGIAGLLLIALLAFVPGRRARVAQAALATVGAIVAVGLLVIQAMIGTFCRFCVVVDVVAVVLCGVSLARAIKAWDPPARKAHVVAGLSLLLLAIAAPLVVGFLKKPIPLDVPAVIAEEIEKTPRGKVTVIDFADFECPHCRRTHAALAPLLEERKDKVRVARKHVPLRMHPHAMDAARGAHCGEEMGKAEEMADALFEASKEELTKEGIEALAGKVGLDVAAFRECVRDARTDARIKSDSEAFRASEGKGLPTLWIDGTKLEGAQEAETLKRTLDAAIEAR